MRKLNSAVAITLAMLVSACGSEPQPESARDIDVAVKVAKEKAKAANAMVEATPDPTEIAAAAAVVTNSFPQSFRGRWGLVPNDCDPARDDAKGLMEVDADTLRFYEARAKLQSITQPSPTEAFAELAYSGEGQTWTRSATFTIEDNGRTLVRAEKDQSGPLRYSRCPAA